MTDQTPSADPLRDALTSALDGWMIPGTTTADVAADVSERIQDALAARDRETAAKARADALEEALRFTQEDPRPPQVALRALAEQANASIGAGDE